MTRLSLCFVPVFLALFIPGRAGNAAEALPSISAARKDAHGFLVHTVKSPFQAGTTRVRVLLPEKLDTRKRHRVLYVLPVERQDGRRYGFGLLEAKRAKLHDKYGLICVEPTFSHLPWYADHPTDKSIRQESYLLKVVIPLIESRYPARKKPADRLLVGFSKSGWGAWSLLLRNPDVFGKAAAWDAPLMQSLPNRFGMGPIFGTRENFRDYEITALLRRRAKLLRKSNRLVLTGYGNFRKHHVQVREILNELGAQCVYLDGPHRKHVWGSGWLPEIVERLVSR